MHLLRQRRLPPSSVLVLLLFALAVACLGSYAMGQATNAQIGGRVIDQTGAVIPNATSATLNLNSVRTSDAASYSVTATNSSGRVTSIPAVITIR